MDWSLLLGIGTQLVSVIGNLARNARAIQAQAELSALQQTADEKAQLATKLQNEVNALDSELKAIASQSASVNLASYMPYIALAGGFALGWVVIK